MTRKKAAPEISGRIRYRAPDEPRFDAVLPPQRCYSEERARWYAAARAAGQEFSAWLRDTLNNRAKRSGK